MVIVGHRDSSERRATQSALGRLTPVKDMRREIGDSKSALGIPGARPLVKDARKSVTGLAALACALEIAGCAAGARPAPPAPLMVQVPVLHQTPCPAPTLAPPALPLAGLEAGSPPADTIRAYAAAVAILKGAVRERDAVLAGCARARSAAPAPVENVQ